MKKFIYRLICYIGLSLTFFNPQSVLADNSIPLPFEEQLKEVQKKEQAVIAKNNDFIKLLAVFLLADKLYPEDKINGDITGLLHVMWPKEPRAKLEKLSKFVQFFVMIKRRHNYVTEGLKHKIKASGILPEDAPIIAKDGEFAPAYSDETKETAPNEYKVKYIPYKYLEYDGGKFGEPVRLRDKNYEPIKETVLDELNLAILNFDIPGFFKALRKLPQSNDGTREKTVELEDGAKSRLLLDLVGLGPDEEVKAVMEVYVPRGWYINGDFLNTQSKPKFFLSEDKTEDLNIKEFQVFYPNASGVTNHGKARRVYVGSTRFPITFTRRDVNKGINIRGSFQFEMCKIKTDECHTVVSHNSLKRPPSVDRMTSLHTNFVSVGYSRVPPQKSHHAQVKAAYYNPQTQKLTVKFATSKKFNNVAAMAEDSARTGFVAPQYNIDADEITANFDIIQATPEESNYLTQKDLENSLQNGGDIAITASFDNREIIRDVIKPELIQTSSIIPMTTTPKYGKAFLFGLLLNLMPGILFFLQRLLRLFSEKKKPYRIFIRYAVATALGLGIWILYSHFNPWYAIYENAFISTSVLILAVSYSFAMLGYMNFNLFRPFKKFMPRGLFIGLFTILFAVAAPCLFKTDIMDNISVIPLSQAFVCTFFIWLGLITFPFIGLYLRQKMSDFPVKLQYINLPYMTIFALEILFIIYGCRGILGLLTGLFAGSLAVGIWYIYPIAITETIQHKRSLPDKELLFKKVQYHCCIAISILWLMSCVIMSFIPLKTQNIPYIEEIQSIATQNIKQDKPLLFVLTQNWSPVPLFMDKTFKYLQEHGVALKLYKASAEDPNMSLWLKTYGRTSPQLSILFTSRHPQGLVLPQSLHNFEWREAFKIYPKTEQQRKENEQ